MLKNFFLLNNKMYCKHMSLAISVINSITPPPRLAYRTQHYHLKSLPSIPMGYTKCHNVNKIPPAKVTYVDE